MAFAYYNFANEAFESKEFDYFYYYEANVEFEGERYPLYLNVGMAHNDLTYHIYDITKK